MGVLDVAVVIAIITAFGGFAGGLVTLMGNKNQKVIDLISDRLAQAEGRLDHLEAELQEERKQRLITSVYAEALRSWAIRAWHVIRRVDPHFDAPPTRMDAEALVEGDKDK